MNNYTVIIPTRNNLDYANKSIKCVLNNSDCRIILLDDHSGSILEYYRNERVNLVFNTQKQSLSQLWNQGILLSRTDNIIIMSHRSRPEGTSFTKLNELLQKKYSFVGLKGFHFFGFNKYLLSILGLFDDSYKSANYEDNDFVFKNFEHNLGYYLNDVNDIKDEGESSWKDIDTSANKNYFNNKWFSDCEKKLLKKLIIEKNLDTKNLFKKFKKIEYLKFCDTVDTYMNNHYPYLKDFKLSYEN